MYSNINMINKISVSIVQKKKGCCILNKNNKFTGIMIIKIIKYDLKKHASGGNTLN